MRKWIFSLLFFITSLVQLSAHSQARVAGTVCEKETGAPISDARVDAISFFRVQDSTCTEEDGSYSMRMRGGWYTMIARARGHQCKAVGCWLRSYKTTTVDFSLLSNGGTIAGKVKGPCRRVIIGAVVEVYQGPTLIAVDETDCNGSFSISNLSPKCYTVLVKADGFRSCYQGAIVKAGATTTADFVLSAEVGAVSGRVIDAVTSNCIKDALVEVFDGPTLVGFASTDANGEYRVRGLAPGSCNVVATAELFQEAIVGAIIEPCTNTVVDFEMKPSPGTICGKVTDRRSRVPLAGALVKVLKGSTYVASVLTDANGDYILSGLAPGSYHVEAAAEEFQGEVVGAEVEAGGTTWVNFSLASNPGLICGAVMDLMRGGISGAIVEVFEGPTLVGSGRTSGKGEYLISGLAPGNCIVVAKAEEFQEERIGAEVTSGNATWVNFTLSPNPGAICGTVIDQEGAPIAGAIVRVVQGSFVVQEGLTDAKGDYIFSGFAPGNYQVEVMAETFQSARVGAQVDAGDTTWVNFTLSPRPGKLVGTVMNRSRVPLVGAVVEVFEGPILITSALTDAKGNFKILGLAPGGYEVKAKAEGYRCAVIGAMITAGGISKVDFKLVSSFGSVEGTVTDTSSAPISGAAVDVYEGSSLVASALTDEKGSYRTSGLSPGNCIVEVKAESFQEATVGAIVNAGSTTTVNFQLASKPGYIVGKVVDSSGMCVVGALVRVFDGSILVGSALTDKHGYYKISGLAPGNYQVEAAAEQFQEKIVGATVYAQSETQLDFTLLPSPGSIMGKVLRHSHSPIPGALVQVFEGLVVIEVAHTDMKGEYQISGLAPGNYQVEASADSFQSAIVGAAVQAGAATKVDFTLIPHPGVIVGKITDRSGVPIRAAHVDVFQGPNIVASTLADAEGEFIFSGLAPGTYNVEARADLFQSELIGAIVHSGETTRVDFELASNPGAIAGRVTDASRGLIAGARVQVLQGPILIGSVFTDANGNYMLKGLAPGGYNVEVIAEGFQSGIIGAIVTSNATTRVDFALTPNGGIIAGKVTSGSRGAIRGALVEVFQGTAWIASALTDSSGEYTISNLAPGNYNVEAKADGLRGAAVGAMVTAGNTTRVDFALTSNPGTLVGNVVDPTFDPIPGALIEVFQGVVLVDSALTDVSGNYSIPGLVPGTYNVTASAGGFQNSVTSATIGEGATTTIDFVLALGPGTIDGRVTNTSMTPVPGAFVQVTEGPMFRKAVSSNSVGFENSMRITSVLTDENGGYIITGLEPGIYSLEAAAAGFQDGLAGATVSEETTTTVNFTLEANPGTIVGTVRSVHTKTPLPGASVGVFDGSNLIGFSLTDPDGNYRIPGLPANTFTVVAELTGYNSALGTATVLQDVGTLLNFFLVSRAFPPDGITGRVLDDRFLTQTDKVNRIQWGASPTVGVAEYRVYRDGVLIGTVFPQQVLEYLDHNRNGERVTYGVTAVNEVGEESSAVTITLVMRNT